MPPKRKQPEHGSLPAVQTRRATRRATRQTPVLPPRPPTSAISRLTQGAGVGAPTRASAAPLTRASSASQPRPTTVGPAGAGMTPASSPGANSTATTTTATTATTTTAAPTTSLQTPVPVSTPPGRLAASRSCRRATRSALPPLLPSPAAGQKRVPVPVLAPAPPRTAVVGTYSLAGQSMSRAVLKENIRASDLVAPEITYHVPQSPLPGRTLQSSLLRPHGPSALPPRLERRPAPPVVTPAPPPKPPALAVSEPGSPRADRNIDKVVLGNLCFRTWYPSYYGKEVLGDTSGNATSSGGSKDGSQDSSNKNPRKEKDVQPMLERLYVCPGCFKYAKELLAWRGHVRICERSRSIPGKKIYTHPRGRRKVLTAQEGAKGPGTKRRRGDGSTRYTEEIVEDEGEWSIWEVDGEKNGLFCQNLSLFAKLFLDNKSVFFDVSGFNYFLLVYTPPATPSVPETDLMPKQAPQVTGFFSKEKMSWDNNNLACILVFPPWQRKGLGALLMGASYEISRREGILGGPEKPISDLGKKGYKRFWSGEISRWLLGLESTAAHPETQTPTQGQSQGAIGPAQELIVDVNDCSQSTWIAVEDCLSVLRDMGIVEDAGMGYGKPQKLDDSENSDDGEMPDDAQRLNLADMDGQTQDAGSRLSEDNGSGSKPTKKNKVVDTVVSPRKLVPRVRIDKEAVRRYVAMHRISLERMCDPEGFAAGYAVKTAGEGDADSAKHVVEST
ncbi:hypothetical protein E4U14_006684 [Claviceps sp. LM454 group G7]|nr:hypothetical protein E4U14_006684 [Claviceps sp. LM454 group G7]